MNLYCLTVCPNLLKLNETSGVITSPFYPRLYPNNQACSWQIAASKGNRIKLVIDNMKIDWCGTSCQCDYLEIQNGSIPGGSPSGHMCGYLMGNATFFSFKESLKLLFASNGYWRTSGFKSTYTQVNFSGKRCCILSLETTLEKNYIKVYIKFILKFYNHLSLIMLIN